MKVSQVFPLFYALFCSPIRAIYHNYHILSDLTTPPPPPPTSNKLWAVEFMELLIMQISVAFCYFLLNANTVLSTLYSNNLNVISSLNMSDHVLQM